MRPFSEASLNPCWEMVKFGDVVKNAKTAEGEVQKTIQSLYVEVGKILFEKGFGCI
jgi:hypothetical protein